MADTNNEALRQSVAQIEETVTAVTLLKAGIAGLESPDPGDDTDHIVLQSLSSGFERLVKVVLIFHAVQTTGRVSTRPWPPNVKGHDVLALLDVVLDRCYSPAFYANQAPAIRDDARFLSSNSTLRELMRILTHHGIAGRYHDLDAALGQPQNADASPSQELDRLEFEIMQRNFADWAERMASVVESMQMETAARRQLSATCRRAARALARLFTLSPLAPVASPLTGVIAPFLFLRDEQL